MRSLLSLIGLRVKRRRLTGADWRLRLRLKLRLLGVKERLLLQYLLLLLLLLQYLLLLLLLMSRAQQRRLTPACREVKVL